MGAQVVLLPHPRMPPRWVILVVGIVLVAMVAVGLWWTSRSDQRAIARLPAVQRAELFRRTYGAARAECAANTGLRSECRSQAELLLNFPECDRVCRDFARAQLSAPAR